MSRKHKHRKHKCCNGGNQHQCGENCQCGKVEKIEISTREELQALINLIIRNGKEREARQNQKDVELANAMLADVESEVITEDETPLTIFES